MWVTNPSDLIADKPNAFIEDAQHTTRKETKEETLPAEVEIAMNGQMQLADDS